MRILYSLLFFISFSVCSAQLVPTFSGGTVTGYSGSGDTLVIPATNPFDGTPITEISNGAFNYYYNLTTLTLPDSLTKIGDSAFYGCSGLTSLTLPDSLTEIGSQAFYNCSGLTSLTLPDSLTKIGSWAFYNCTSLRINNLPNSLTTLGSDVFYNCGLNGNLDSYGLPIANEVTLPNGILVVPIGAFEYSCFTKINLHENVKEIQNVAFKDMPYLTEITIPASVNYLGNDIFQNCSRLTSVTFEGNLPAYSLSSFSAGNTSTAIPSIYYKNFSETWELHNQAIGLPLIYLGPPTISLNPQDVTANEGSTATISVTASDVLGNSLNYQWLKNGVDVDGETSSSIVFQSISGSDAGNYQVVLSNGNGTTISESASVSILSSSTSYTQEQYDAALTTGFNLGVQSVSTSEPVTDPPAEPAPDELPSGNVPDSLAGLIEVYSGSTFSENDVFTDAIYYPSDTILQYSDGSSITSGTYSWDKDTQTLSGYNENGAVSYTVIYEFFETSNKSIYVQNYKVYNVDPDGETELSGEGFGFMYDADGDLNQNTVSDKEEWIGQSYTTATNFDSFLTDKTTITSNQIPNSLPQLRTESISTITQAAYDAVVAERDAALEAQVSAEAERDAKLTLDEIKDLRAGSKMIEIHNGQATLTMEVEESDDLGVWTNGSATSIQIPIDADAGKKFFRFKMTE